MIETISKKVAPSAEQSTINLMTSFGWTVKSSQEINSKESHLENRDGDLYSVTSKENYVKLLFERNTEMKNYAEIVQLERKYNQLSASNKLKFEKNDIIITVVLTVLFFPVGIGFGLYKLFKASMNAQKNLIEKGNPIIAEARRLL